ncbi:MAG: hypothetical protein IJ300_14350 [Clostridia bacterium]|nr:hypothetical protein [Clostridia bacterium]
MEKIFRIFLVGIIIISFRSIAINLYLLNNQNYDVEIKDIKVKLLSEQIPSYEKLFHIYGYEKEYGWTEELEKEVKENEDDYVIVTIQYVVKNNSENIVMEKIRFDFNVISDISDKVKAYNCENSTYFLYAYPKQEAEMQQHILIKKEELTKDEVYKSIINSKVIIGWNAAIKTNIHNIRINKNLEKTINIYSTVCRPLMSPLQRKEE